MRRRMAAGRESSGDEAVVSPLPEDQRTEADNVLLAATVHELREHAERLDRTTAELRAQNELLAQAQKAVEAERSRYRELFELAPDSWLLTDANGRIVEANERASELLGVQARLLAGEPLAAYVEESSQPTLRHELNALSEGGGRRRSELRIVPHDGAVLDVEAKVVPVTEREDQGALLWLLRDVTERVGAARRLGEQLSERTSELETTRKRLERERVHLRDLFHRLQEGVITVDARLHVVFSNRAAKHFFEPVQLVDGEPLPGAWSGIDLHALTRTLFTRRPTLREIEVSSSAGHVLSIRGIPALGAETAGLVINDVSTRARRERAEREFVANAAHELRTPLTAISGAVEVLQAGAKDDPGERDRFLAHIERESARLGRLTSALLVLARAQMGVESPRLELVEIRPLLEQAAADMRAPRGVRVDVRCARGLAAFANRALVEQALGNLAGNAAKNTRHGTIVLRAKMGDSGWVTLEVADTGRGMRPEERAQASERFYRAGGEPGFGLGLAIASEAARALGGRLELDSEAGRGTTARMLLPSAQVVSRA
jgi:PAS domain S-box-containing protein